LVFLVCIWGIFAIGNISGEMGRIDAGESMRLMQLGFVPLLGLLIAVVSKILGEVCKNKPNNLAQNKEIKINKEGSKSQEPLDFCYHCGFELKTKTNTCPKCKEKL
jgi:hypothetical protein